MPATMTTVPARIGRVTRSPRMAMAKAVATSGVMLRMDEATGAPTLSMATTRNRRPPAVPIKPEATK